MFWFALFMAAVSSLRALYAGARLLGAGERRGWWYVGFTLLLWGALGGWMFGREPVTEAWYQATAPCDDLVSDEDAVALLGAPIARTDVLGFRTSCTASWRTNGGTELDVSIDRHGGDPTRRWKSFEEGGAQATRVDLGEGAILFTPTVTAAERARREEANARLAARERAEIDRLLDQAVDGEIPEDTLFAAAAGSARAVEAAYVYSFAGARLFVETCGLQVEASLPAGREEQASALVEAMRPNLARACVY